MRKQVEVLKAHADFAADLVDLFQIVGQFVPSTRIWPAWCSSRRLMQRIMVDLPDPDGPQMTIRSPRITAG
jgi:hypothetical protein